MMQADRIEECFICRKHRGEILIPGGAIYEDDLLYVGHILAKEISSTYLGYIMVDIKRHAKGLADLTDEEAKAFGLMEARISRALKNGEGAEHVYSFVLGDHVPHFHAHLIARYPGTPSEFWGNAISNWPDAPRGGEKELENLCQRIRTYLEEEMIK